MEEGGTPSPTRRDRSASKKVIGRGLLYNHASATKVDIDWESQLERAHDDFTEDAAARRRRFMRTDALSGETSDSGYEVPGGGGGRNPYVGLANKHKRDDFRRSMVDMRGAEKMYAAWPRDEMEGLILYCEKLRSEKIAAEKQLADLHAARARESAKAITSATSGGSIGTGYFTHQGMDGARRQSISPHNSSRMLHHQQHTPSESGWMDPLGGDAFTPVSYQSHPFPPQLARSPSLNSSSDARALNHSPQPNREHSRSTPVFGSDNLQPADMEFLSNHYDSL